MGRDSLAAAFPSPTILGKLKSDRPRIDWFGAFAGYYILGRFANFWAMKATRLAPGTPAWLPSYHCGDEVRATLDAGFDVRYYHVGRDLNIDVSDLEEKVRKNPGPVLIIHYFGMPQESTEQIAGFCKSIGMPLIEDCAHALFSGHRSVQLGEFGPLAVFSVRKTLGVYDGGLLRLDPRKYREWTGAEPGRIAPGDFSLDPYVIMLKDRVRRLVGSRITELYHQIRWRGREHQPHVIVGFRPEDSAQLSPAELVGPYSRGMSWVTRRLARNADPDSIIARRRRNWHKLDQQLQGSAHYRKVYAELPDDCCPLVLPVWVANNMDCKSHLEALGVNTYVFGAIPHPSIDQQEFQESKELSRNILGLPIHQDLSDDQIAGIARTVRKYFAQMPDLKGSKDDSGHY